MPSSLARVLSCALESSSRLPVSVCGTVRWLTSSEAFLGSVGPAPSPLARLPVTSRFDGSRICLRPPLRVWTTKTISWRCLPFCVPPLALWRNLSGTGILTCFPSPTGFPLGLGTDSPRVDERCPGILRLSAKTVLASFNATYAGIITSVRSRGPCDPPSSRAERSSTIILADHPQRRFHA